MLSVLIQPPELGKGNEGLWVEGRTSNVITGRLCLSVSLVEKGVIFHAHPEELVIPARGRKLQFLQAAPGQSCGSWKGSGSLAVTHFLCPKRGARSGVMPWLCVTLSKVRQHQK